LLPDPAYHGGIPRLGFFVRVYAGQRTRLAILPEFVGSVGALRDQVGILVRAIHSLRAALLAGAKGKADQKKTRKFVHHLFSITGSYDECKPMSP